MKTGVKRKQEEGTDVEAVKKKKRKRKHTKISKSGMLLFAIQEDTTGVNWYDIRIGYKQTIKTASIRRHLSLQQASKKISFHHGDGGLEISLVQQWLKINKPYRDEEYSLSECCSQKECGHLPAACRQKLNAAGQGECWRKLHVL